MPRRKELSDAVRRNLAGMDRLGAGKLLDRMMIAIRDGEAPDVGKWMQELGLHKAFALGEKIRREQVELAAAYDRVLHQPLGGSQDEVLATLAPEDIERVLVHRGPAVLKDGEISVQGRALKQAGLSKRGFGLVKVIFLHEEKGMKRQEMPRVQREDVSNMPRAIREYAPITHEVGANGDGVTRWNIPHADGNYLAIVVGRGQDGPDSRLVSMFVDSPEGPVSPKRNRPESLLPSARLGEGYMADGLGVLSDSASPDGKNSIAESSASVVSPNRNTSQEISRFTPDGQDGVIENISSGSRIDVDSASVNVRAVSDFTAPAPKTVIKSVYQEKTGGIGKRLDRKKSLFGRAAIPPSA